jgi:hypothetical protein
MDDEYNMYNTYKADTWTDMFTKFNTLTDDCDVRTYVKFSDVKNYVSTMESDAKIAELLDTIGEDVIQTYLRTKKIKRIQSR